MFTPSKRRLVRKSCMLTLEKLEDRVVPDGVPAPPPGQPPVAVNDDTSYNILQTSSPVNVLGNDLDGNPGATWDYSSLTVVTLPQHGFLSLDTSTGQFLYTPAYMAPPGLPPGSPPPPAQQDSFTYHVKNSLGMQSNTATVTLIPVGAPKEGYIVSFPDIAATRSLQPVVIDLLANDELRHIGRQFDYSSVKFDQFANDSLPRHGTVTFDPTNGAATYTPDFGYVGWDRFVYQVSTNVGGPDEPFPGEFFTNGDEVFVIIGMEPPRLQSDPLGGQMLVVDGSHGDDTIAIVPGDRRGEVKAILNGVTSPSFRPTGRIVVFGYGGNDSIVVSPSVRHTTWLVGGASNDLLMAGGGPALLLGNEGNDTLLGGLARDVLIGGAGQDSLTAAFAGDLLVGGSTRFDTQQSNLADLLSRWAHNGRKDSAHGLGHDKKTNRREALANADVIDDGKKDTLVSRRGADLVFAGVGDEVVQRRGADDWQSWHDRDAQWNKAKRRFGSYSLIESPTW